MTSLDHARSPLDDGRDIVIYPRGAAWGFRLPEQHTISIVEEQGLVFLATPDHGSGFRLDRVEETAGELRILLGFETSDGWAVGSGRVPEVRPYGLPAIQDELARLRAELVARGGNAQDADAWAQGATYGSHTETLRVKIREIRRAEPDCSLP